MLTDVAKAAGLKTSATNDFHYLTREDARAQDCMLCIGTGAAFNDANRMRFENDQFYMKTEEEMREALKDFPEACDTTVEVAEKVNVVLERDSILPRFPLPEGETEESYFRKRCLLYTSSSRSSSTTWPRSTAARRCSRAWASVPARVPTSTWR